MAENILEIMVLHGKPVTGETLTGTACTGSNQAKGQTPARLSDSRLPSQRFQGTSQAPARHFLVEPFGGKVPAGRAGRPGSVAGVLGYRNPARDAQWTVLCGWPMLPIRGILSRGTGLIPASRSR